MSTSSDYPGLDSSRLALVASAVACVILVSTAGLVWFRVPMVVVPDTTPGLMVPGKVPTEYVREMASLAFNRLYSWRSTTYKRQMNELATMITPDGLTAITKVFTTREKQVRSLDQTVIGTLESLEVFPKANGVFEVVWTASIANYYGDIAQPPERIRQLLQFEPAKPTAKRPYVLRIRAIGTPERLTEGSATAAILRDGATTGSFVRSPATPTTGPATPVTPSSTSSTLP